MLGAGRRGALPVWLNTPGGSARGFIECRRQQLPAAGPRDRVADINRPLCWVAGALH